MKSISTRIFLMFLVLIFLCFIIIGGMLYTFLGNYYAKKEGTALFDTAQRISELTINVLQDENFNLLKGFYAANIEAYSRETGYGIIVIDDQANTISSSSNASSMIGKKGIPEKIVTSVLSGLSMTSTKAYSDNLGSSIMTAGYPIMLSDKSVIGGVFCIVSMPFLDELRRDIIYMIFVAMLAAFFVAVVLAIVFSRQIIKPIRQLNHAAKLVSMGDFSQQVDIRYDDEIGELTKTFNEMTVSLGNLENMRSSFIANISHELRTPMTIIIGFLEGILDGTIEKEEQAKYLNISLSEVKRLSRLTTDFLDIAKIEAGNSKLNLTKFDINEQIRLNIFRFDQQIIEKDLKIQANFSSDECMVNADFDAIQRVLTNLTDNAVKFTPRSGEITFDVRKKNGKAEISISNTGDGIDPDEIQLIWERFYKTDKSRSIDKKGVGLGLYIIKSLVKQHNEDIMVSCGENPKGTGKITTFTFTLKLA